MRRTRATACLYAILTAVLLTGCEAPPAYVHKIGEFNRALPTFAKEPENIDSVTICYNKFGTKPETVVKMASAECARYNKRAEFRHQSFEICPLFTPVAAVFACAGADEKRKYLN